MVVLGVLKVFELCLSTSFVYSEEGNCQRLFVQWEPMTIHPMASGIGEIVAHQE